MYIESLDFHLYRMRRPQSSLESFNRRGPRGSNCGDKGGCDQARCSHCLKLKASLSRAFSKEDPNKGIGSIGLESKIQATPYAEARHDTDGPWGGKGTSNMSNIQMEQLKSIIENNMKYYKQKTKVCCSVKPPRQKLTLPCKTAGSVYKGDYNKKPFDSSLSFKKLESYKPVYPFDPNTTYKQNFVPHRSLTPQSAKPRHTPMEDGPRFMNTQYKAEFLPWEARSSEKFGPVKNELFGTGNFDPRTVYNSDFLGRPAQRSQNQKNSNGSSIFKGFDMPKVSNYQGQFYRKPMSKQNNYMPKYQATPGVPHEGQYHTEYKNEFVPKEKEHCHYKKEYNAQEMTNMILNL